MWPQRAQPANTYPPGLPGRTGHQPQTWGGDCLSLLRAAHSAALFLVTKCSASFWGEITAPQLCLHMVWVSGSEHMPPGLPGECHGSRGGKVRSEGKIMAHGLFCKDLTHLKGCKKKKIKEDATEIYGLQSLKYSPSVPAWRQFAKTCLDAQWLVWGRAKD